MQNDSAAPLLPAEEEKKSFMFLHLFVIAVFVAEWETTLEGAGRRKHTTECQTHEVNCARNISFAYPAKFTQDEQFQDLGEFLRI